MTRLIRNTIGVVLCLFFVLPQLEAQQIKYAEYFFDNDPGRGNATSVAITQANTIDATYSIPTSALSTGIHFLYFRVQDTDTKWSLVYSKLVYITNSDARSNIDAMEYFIDNDPGKGSGTAVSVTTGSTVDINEVISSSGLSSGIHFIYFRVKNVDGQWSLVKSKLVFITNNTSNSDIVSAEYFIDDDPGIGSGISVSVTAGSTVDITESMSTSGLSTGIHLLYYRVQNADGIWSLTSSKLLYITENVATSDIIAAEYFFDNDPGNGNATALSVSAGANVNISTTISVASIDAGLHSLYVRVKDADGKWSLSQAKLIYKSEHFSNSNIVAAEYFYDQDPGYGNATSISISAADTINITTALATDNLSAGIHKLNIRVKDQIGKWSLNARNLVYIMAGNLTSPEITEVEYFFDTDPGNGNATSINITSGNTIDISEAISSSALSIGHHQFFIRAKDLQGRWSICDKRLVYVSPAMVEQKIAAIEYSVDTIMPWGQGNMINFAATDSLDYTFDFAHGLADTLYHSLYTRVKTVGGQWSLIDSVRFKLENCIIPTAQFNINNICFGDSITLFNNSIDVDTSTVYEWNIGDNNSIESTDSLSYKIGFSQIGTYKVSLKATNMVCVDTMLKSITVYPRPDTTISTFGNVDFCPGSFTVLSANTGVGYQYQWFQNGNIINNANSSFYQAQDSGRYFAAVSNVYNCSDTTAFIDINVYDLPTASIILSGTNSFCQSDSVILTANQDAGLTYQWFRNGSLIIGASDVSIIAKQAGDYQVEISNINGCTDISTLVTLNVNPLPMASITSGGSLEFCQGDNVLLYGSNGIGYSYQWYKDTNLISGATSSFVSATESGSYRVYIENTFQCGDTASGVDIIVNPSPNSDIVIIGQQTVCQGDTVKLASVSSQGLTYQWKSYGTNLAGATNSFYNALQTGNYALVATNSFNCSTESSQYLATVNPVPGASVLPLSSTSFCGGDSVILQANVGNGLSYQWYKDNNLLVNDTLTSLSAFISGAYSVEVENEFNCSTLSVASNVTSFPVPSASFNLNNEVCSSDTVIISYTGSASAGAFYNWDFAGATVLSGTGQGPYELIWSLSGAKLLELTVNENSCSSESYYDTTLVKTVIANIIAPVTSVCQGDTVILTANSGFGLNYQWLQSGIEMLNDTLSAISLVNSGVYQIKVSDEAIGCYQVSTPISVTVNPTDFSLSFNASNINFSQPPFDVIMNNTTPNMNSYNFLWELGDGNTSTFYNPIHTYQYNGSYTVAMYAENSTTGCRDTLVKTDYIQCAGGAPNPCNITAAITPPGPATICQGDSVLLAASAGTGYTYQWVYNNLVIPNADSVVFYAKQSGNYRVIITDAICSQTSPAFVLNQFPSIQPVIQVSGIIQPCTNDSLNLSLLVNYNTYNWNTGDTVASIFVTQTGYYQVAVTDNYGCNMTSSQYMVSNSYLNPPELCLVGVDTLNHNRLVWERQQNALIDSFYVYKEGYISGQYDKIGAIPFNQTSIFVDQNSNPAIKAYKYKIAAVDTCGGHTLLGDYHKTIHLTINAGLNGSWNLIWDGYEGFAFNTYRIYRGTNTNNMSLLTQLASTANSYTDLNPPTGTVYYQIEVIKTTGCYPDTAYAKVNTNYNSSRSNTANNANITPVFLAAEFGADAMIGTWPIQISFSDNSTGEPDAWHWSFGDGNTSVEQNPAHTYNNTGLYTVSLAICNGEVCDTIIKTDYIEVLPNGMVDIDVLVNAKIYPNPNDGSFTIEINDKAEHQLQLHLFNNLGSEVYFESFKSRGKTIKRLNLNNLSTGVYYVHINSEEKMVYKSKLIIQR